MPLALLVLLFQNMFCVGPSCPDRRLLFKRVTLTAAQVKTLNSAPITLIPGEAGYFYWVETAIFIKSGTEFTGGAAAGNIEVEYLNTANTNAIALNAAFLDTAGENGRFQSTGISGLISSAAADFGGKGLRVVLSIADVAGTGSDCHLMLYYYKLPAGGSSVP